METAEFKAWRQAMEYSQRAAADALGLSRVTIELYERGTRRDDGRAVTIPRTVALACAALRHGLSEGDATRAPGP